MQVRDSLQDIRQAHKEKDIEKLLEIINNFKTTPAHLREQGCEMLCELLAKPLGLELFAEDKDWRDAVTVDELNQLSSFGRNAVSLICCSREWRSILDEDETLRRKITTQGLNAGKRSLSAAYQLLVYSRETDLLFKHSDLREKISVAMLNDGEVPDIMPLVYELSKSKTGIELLVDPIIRQKILAEGLNRVAYFYSSIYFMTRHPEGLALLADEVFREKLSSHSLNHLTQESRSAVYNICASEEGCEMMEAYDDLRRKVTAIGLNTHGRGGTSALYYLIKSPAGRRALLASKYLCKLIDEDTLNEVCMGGNEAGASPVFYLIATPEGRELLQREKKLRAMVHRFALFSEVKHGEFAGCRAVDFLLHADNESLLRSLSLEVQQFVDMTRNDHPEQTLLLQQSSAGFFRKVDVKPFRNNNGEEHRSEKNCVIL